MKIVHLSLPDLHLYKVDFGDQALQQDQKNSGHPNLQFD